MKSGSTYLSRLLSIRIEGVCFAFLLFLGDYTVIEPILLGIVMGLIPVTLAGLFVAAYLQYKRGNQLGLD